MSCVCESGMMPLAARQPQRAAQAEQVVVRRRDANRSAGVAAHARRGEIGGHRRAGPAARSAGHARRIVGVARLPAERADRRDARGELVQVRLADDDRAGVAQLRHHERVAAGREAGERDRSAGRRHVRGRVVVLDDNRDAVQRPARAARGALAVERVGLVERVRVERDHRVERRPGVVVGADARQVGFDEVARCHGARRPSPPAARGSTSRTRRTPPRAAGSPASRRPPPPARPARPPAPPPPSSAAAGPRAGAAAALHAEVWCS